MHAIMLAAGRGIRLSNGAGHPKCLLEFGGKTLLRRPAERKNNAVHATGTL